jgi:hypothetical protein
MVLQMLQHGFLTSAAGCVMKHVGWIGLKLNTPEDLQN